MIKNYSSLQFTKEFQASNRLTLRMNQGFQLNMSGKSLISIRMKLNSNHRQHSCYQMKRQRLWPHSQPSRKKTIILMSQSMLETSMTTSKIQLDSSTQDQDFTRATHFRLKKWPNSLNLLRSIHSKSLEKEAMV